MRLTTLFLLTLCTSGGACSSVSDVETQEAKLDWFLTLTFVERMNHLDSMYRLVVGLNPELRGGLDAGPPAASVRVLELGRR